MRSAADVRQQLGGLPGDEAREGLHQHGVCAEQDVVEHGEAVAGARPVVEEDDDRDDGQPRDALEGHDQLGLGIGVGRGEDGSGVEEGVGLVGCVELGSALVDGGSLSACGVCG